MTTVRFFRLAGQSDRAVLFTLVATLQVSDGGRKVKTTGDIRFIPPYKMTAHDDEGPVCFWSDPERWAAALGGSYRQQTVLAKVTSTVCDGL